MSLLHSSACFPGAFENGWVELIFGPMYSSKTTTAMRIVSMMKLLKKRVLVLRHADDNRYDDALLSNHDEFKIPAVSGTNLEAVHHAYADSNGFMPFDCIVVDEVHMWNTTSTVRIVEKWREQGLIVVCTGLDQDATGTWFPVSCKLCEIKDAATFLTSVCMRCKRAPAPMTWAFEPIAEGEIRVGGTDQYMPVCSSCFRTLKKEREEKINLK